FIALDPGLNVCADLTVGSSPLTQTGMIDFAPGHVVIEAAQHKRVKYEAKCADIGYGFLPFSLSSFGELERDAVTLLKRIRRFSVTQDIGARPPIHIFNRIGFAICIVTASVRGFSDCQWRLSTLSFAFGGLVVYSAGDVLNYAFLMSRLQSASLQTKLLRHSGIVASGTTFDDALCVFNTKMKTDLLSNLSEIAAPKLMKKLTDIYFTRVTQTAEFNFSLSSRQMALW
ncbi:hypothetical protein Tco_0069147, partial [Tanacetum coccineum]